MPSMKACTLWFFLLLQVVFALGTDTQQVLSNGDGIEGGRNKDEPPPAQFQPETAVGEHHRPDPKQPGADLVDAALYELRNVPIHALKKPRRPRSVFDAAFEFILTALPTFTISAPPAENKQSIRGPLSEAVCLLEQAALQNNSDALHILADMNFYGKYSHPKDLKVAFDHYKTLASHHGNSTAQYMVGVFYATGLGNVVAPDQARAMIYYTFAALQGDTRAQMAIGYRHHSGIATAKNCEQATKYYKQVADQAIQWYRLGPPGGMAWVSEAYRIADDAGGVYGEGASAASAGMNAIRAAPNSDANAAIDDVIEYLDLMSQRGDVKASFNLGRIYYEGQRGMKRNLDLARKYFFMVAKRYWKKDGRVIENHKPGIEKVAGRAAGYIGRMYLRGDGVEQSLEQAHRWFTRGISHGDPQSQYGMGLMKLHGYGKAPKNIRMAMDLFKAAAEQDYGPAQVEMGVLYLDQGGPEDVRIASNYFELAARYNLIEANYYLAEMSYHGVGRDKTCSIALNYYKSVAEKAEPLVSTWAEANQAYEAGDIELAFLEYVLTAEQGYERAQNNVAYLLDPLKSRLKLPEFLQLGTEADRPSMLVNPTLALMYWTRSSRQSNVDSQVKMGDYYYYGIGTEADVNKAIQCYTAASDYSQSAQALWNLGWMHENGIGLTQDYHLAKRFYDQALAINEEAYLPVTLSLLRLRLKSAWNTFTHGPIHSIQDDPKPKKDWSLSEWIANFMKDTASYYDDDYYEDIYDENTIPGGDSDILGDDDLTEGLIIVFLALCLVLLLYYRQQIQQRRRRAEETRRQQQQQQQAHGQQGPAPTAPAHQPPQQQQQQQQENQGFFAARDDPGFNNWLAGGFGH
ncbi:HCP-like protein [Sodiomyces alkalinus F11]|uniref:HCP-like protein n=1 Tax=Sodiomyces alkalinus (strain CBS 110278 / VKM F-3762 / F11) TaxID=1314773 RepID=A0A3N2Q6T0_SODAK|nr:HCP-like protein [Sodiomyces alkalinus F11]ROT42325.1 HCP-like protein [Sodiomyces alkalinus F11]